MSGKAPETLQVTINSPDEQIWEGEALSVSSENSAGVFDILPEHANFVTMLISKPVTVREKDGQNKTFNYKRAVLSVRAGKVTIYTDL